MRLRELFVTVLGAALLAVLVGNTPGFAQEITALERQCSGAPTPSQVIAGCDAVIASEPAPETLAMALNNRGNARALLNDFDHAISDFNVAVLLRPRTASLFRNRGTVFALQGNYARAIADFDQALALAPDDVDTLRNRGLAYQYQGNYQRAIGDFDRAIDVYADPDWRRADLLNARCFVRVRWGQQLELALADCEESLRVRPDDANTINSRAAVKFRLNDFAGAEADYDTSLQLAPTMIGSLYGRGVARMRLGRTAEGQADIARAVSREANVAARYAIFGIQP